MADAGHEQVVIVGRTRRTAGYFPPPKEHEASLYRHLLSTVAQVFRSIALQSTHQQELERRVALRTAELKEAQERVVQLEREKIAEQMAGGFAHEMRNALSGAKILIEKGLDETGESGKSPIDRTASELKRMFLIAQKKLDDRTLAIFRSSIAQVVQNERLLDDVLRSVKRAVERALSITTLIMEYSRIGYSEPGADVVDLVSVAQAVVGECSELFAQHDVAATFRVEGTCLVRGTETHFYSIIKNLVANAFDALTEIDDDRPRSLIVDVHSAGDRTVIRVSDNAGGIPPEIRARIFEPFFSTKPQTGTGLGLGMVQKLVALHDGTLELDTTVGRGTTFTVSFAAATRSRDVRLEKAVG
jgi:signal transduction histidine kinase